MAGPGVALVVEDDMAVAAMLRRHLQRADFVVYEASRENEAVRRAAETSPDVIVLDLYLEEGDGSAVCRRIREIPALSDVPILVLTARDELATKVALLETGSDDYVVKPCEPAELIARVHALLRRSESGTRRARRIGRLRVALATGDAWVGATPLELTAAERALLRELARAYPALAPRAQLDRLPWRSAESVSSNVTEVIAWRLRQKLVAAESGVGIHAVRRAGYVLRIQSAEVGG